MYGEHETRLHLGNLSEGILYNLCNFSENLKLFQNKIFKKEKKHHSNLKDRVKKMSHFPEHSFQPRLHFAQPALW